MTLEEFNSAAPGPLTTALRACCDVPAWADKVRAGRPYANAGALVAVADQAARELTAAEVDRALAAHPRIGERAQGKDVESAWSRQEQSAVGGDPGTAAALIEGNRAYEAKFGRVFLICATGLSGEQILANLRERLGHTPEEEAPVVAGELRKIAVLRVRKLVDG
ncbi:2-oxo-4-hydroxy-4-carboxy-5-ureidoimidazoline decarboxylase [Amycolatopsis granulosa]|uniref:2-oxo-4-hydroxy-4-carboxy-5-ureidoimidazoline decarboxylase n=1 Tax=Amycolatopsis granulosa TaxID=185684 RepID=UPI00141DBFF6|nr:2-oxo-4-hydroxy-4-carboxy-5-ureidoimidazoline decarboxylase [Amycolatopsis granulosa]NIH83276.1 2-oxo-4-hydroxy-4-carboxy-5-ureidoimidazoline decarboxylase [Amycolatopsis granulosa]